MESELFTLIIRNVQLENSITRDVQKHLNKKKQQPGTKIINFIVWIFNLKLYAVNFII